ncbi:MAG: hypothetical protein JO235_08425 [Chroococcidiopsidaceae cyanobacterium CP_BM_RX_35]|nr:hypothetical protein [Chroococcidiopsidaceae cyanobacterium CP_BM_RX_35]
MGKDRTSAQKLDRILLALMTKQDIPPAGEALVKEVCLRIRVQGVIGMHTTTLPAVVSASVPCNYTTL